MAEGQLGTGAHAQERYEGERQRVRIATEAHVRGATTYKGHSNPKGSIHGASLEPVHFSLACFCNAVDTLPERGGASTDLQAPVGVESWTGDQDMPDFD